MAKCLIWRDTVQKYSGNLKRRQRAIGSAYRKMCGCHMRPKTQPFKLVPNPNIYEKVFYLSPAHIFAGNIPDIHLQIKYPRVGAYLSWPKFQHLGGNYGSICASSFQHMRSGLPVRSIQDFEARRNWHKIGPFLTPTSGTWGYRPTGVNFILKSILSKDITSFVVFASIGSSILFHIVMINLFGLRARHTHFGKWILTDQRKTGEAWTR